MQSKLKIREIESQFLPKAKRLMELLFETEIDFGQSLRDGLESKISEVLPEKQQTLTALINYLNKMVKRVELDVEAAEVFDTNNFLARQLLTFTQFVMDPDMPEGTENLEVYATAFEMLGESSLRYLNKQAEKSEFGLRSICEVAYRLVFHHTEGLNIQYHGNIRGDESFYFRIFNNIFDYLKAVGVKREKKPEVNICYDNFGEYGMLVIEENLGGIQDEKELFDLDLSTGKQALFSPRKEEAGHHHGLSTVRNLLTLQGHDIYAENYSKGATSGLRMKIFVH